ELLAPFHVGECSLVPLLRDRLAWMATRGLDALDTAAKRMAVIHRRYRPRAVLRAGSGAATAHAANCAAEHLGAAVCVLQHGMISYDEQITQFCDYRDRMTATLTLCWGMGSKSAYTDYAHEFRSQVSAVGSPSLDALGSRSMPLPKQGTVLYATTNYLGNAWYYGFSPAFSDCRFYADQLRIMRCLNGLVAGGRARCVVKLHPCQAAPCEHCRPPPWAEGPLCNSMRLVKNERTFSELLSEADAVVIDFPSTTLLQALTSDRPMFVLMSHWNYPKDARALLERRAVLANDADELTRAIEEHVASGAYAADRANDAFLREFGTHLGDGRSAERAGQAILDLVGRDESSDKCVE
ncbi:MAG TPA: hypothetical protein VGY54_15700, partial [Polyangiaceae bacterium]|nr:hypothetical protein [Polyangiaceae bacterium]